MLRGGAERSAIDASGSSRALARRARQALRRGASTYRRFGFGGLTAEVEDRVEQQGVKRVHAAVAATRRDRFTDVHVPDEVARRKIAELNQRLQHNLFRIIHDFVTFPFTVVALLHNDRFHPSYRMTWPAKFRLAWRMYRNSFSIPAATSWKAHLAMAAKLLEIPPEVEGVVVECGCFLGGSSVNLSLACRAVGRDLILYDSFEGLPAPAPGERYGGPESAGGYRGSLEVVQRNIRAGGDIDRCTFRKGWLSDTLPDHTEPVVLCFVDVDYQDSLRDCIVNLWPHLVERGYVFIDEYVLVDYCALFFSERFWQTNFGITPPGLIGTGSGVGLGHYFVGPVFETPPFQVAQSIAYTYKGHSGFWDYYPDDDADA